MALETLAGIKTIYGFDVQEITDSGAVPRANIRDHIVVDHVNNVVQFKIQNGPIGENGVNGCQVDTLIETARLIVHGLNKKFPCRENSLAITKLEEALTILTCSLFGKPADVDIKACDKAIFICRQQIRWMKKVDETGFNRGVVKPCTTFLQATVTELIKKNITSVEKAKKYLKQAASML